MSGWCRKHKIDYFDDECPRCAQAARIAKAEARLSDKPETASRITTGSVAQRAWAVDLIEKAEAMLDQSGDNTDAHRAALAMKADATWWIDRRESFSSALALNRLFEGLDLPPVTVPQTPRGRRW